MIFSFVFLYSHLKHPQFEYYKAIQPSVQSEKCQELLQRVKTELLVCPHEHKVLKKQREN